MKLQVKDCKHPWENLQILATGEVRVCCWSTQHLGNINESTIDDIWNGKTLDELREFVKSNKLHSICEGAVCPYVQSYVKNL
jgi:lipoate synthase